MKNKVIATLITSFIFGVVILLKFLLANYIHKVKVDQYNLVHRSMEKYWIDELKHKDSVRIAMSFGNNFFQQIQIKKHDFGEVLFFSIPENSCWECIKGKLSVINKAYLNFPIYLLCKDDLVRRIKIQISNENNSKFYHFINMPEGSNHEQDYYFLYSNNKNNVFFIDILTSNELLINFIKQIKNR